MSEAQPETVAGRRLAMLNNDDWTWYTVEPTEIVAEILAIEAEARAAGAARYEAALAEAHWALVSWVNRTDAAYLGLLDRIEPLVSHEAAIAADALLAASPLRDPEQRDGLDVAVRRLLDTVSAAEALGWNWYDGMKRVKALHPISGDLMSAHANLALAATPSRPAEERKP